MEEYGMVNAECGMRNCLLVLGCLVPLSLIGCAVVGGADPSPAPAGGIASALRPPDHPLGKDDAPAVHWAEVRRILQRDGEERDGVYTITVPREDWDVGIEGMSVPTGAGLASVFHFYICPC